MGKTKVLHIIDSIGLGGAQKVLEEILRCKSSKIDQQAYALRERTNQIDIGEVTIHHSASKYSVVPLLRIIKKIQSDRVNILHCHLFRSQAFGLIVKILFRDKIMLIFHEHGEIFQGKLLYRLLIWLAKSKVDLFIAVSKATQQELVDKNNVGKGKVEVIYNPVNIGADLIKKSRENCYQIGFIGRLDKVKGCDILIKAASLLRGLVYKVVIVGDGKEKARLIALASDLGIAESVKFLGFKNHLSAIYDKLDLVVIPSRSESFGISAVEAQMKGIPVIASRLPALCEVIGHSQGIFFKVGDENELANQIIKVSQDTELQKSLAVMGIENAKKFRSELFREKILSVYQRQLKLINQLNEG